MFVSKKQALNHDLIISGYSHGSGDGHVTVGTTPSGDTLDDEVAGLMGGSVVTMIYPPQSASPYSVPTIVADLEAQASIQKVKKARKALHTQEATPDGQEEVKDASGATKKKMKTQDAGKQKNVKVSGKAVASGKQTVKATSPSQAQNMAKKGSSKASQTQDKPKKTPKEKVVKEKKAKKVRIK